MSDWLTSLWQQGSPPIQWGVVVGASLAAAMSDLRTRRIPNRLTGPLLLAGLVWSVCWAGPVGLADSLVGCLILAAPYVGLFLLGGGAGDAKLMGAIGAWLGVVNGLFALAGVVLCGGIVAVGVMIGQRKFRVLVARIGWLLYGLVLLAARQRRLAGAMLAGAGSEKLPYGIAIFVGVCAGAAGALVWRS